MNSEETNSAGTDVVPLIVLNEIKFWNAIIDKTHVAISKTIGVSKSTNKRGTLVCTNTKTDSLKAGAKKAWICIGVCISRIPVLTQ